ncbi:MAG: hypothetical protein DWQ19_11935 [Crenarchaeota archaeon]|mgnify:CR=1 FL=1|nr:MAG: hypothetical protein DWQ19_11935 [Thermoproteota archaeon]
MIPDFFQWVEEQKLELPSLTDETEEKEGNPKLKEDRLRSGVRGNYPDAYARSQYPHKHFNPVAPDTDYYMDAKPRKGGKDSASKE